MRKSFLCTLRTFLAVSALLTTGIAQTRPPVVLFPGYISTKLLVTVENQTVDPIALQAGLSKPGFLATSQTASVLPAATSS